MTQLTTSLDEIRSFNPCSTGWKDILKGQNKTESDSVLFPLIDCVESNSFSDVCWLLGNRKKEIEICVKAARLCAESVANVKNKFSANAAAAANYATAAAADYAAGYAAAEDAAGYAAAAADTAGDAKAAAATATAARSTVDYAAYAAAYETAYLQQQEKNKEFLCEAILAFETTN